MIKICKDIVGGYTELTIYRQLKQGVLATHRTTRGQKPVIIYWKNKKLEDCKTKIINITEEDLEDCDF